MGNGIHLTQMVINVRAEINEPVAGFWADADIIEKINEGQNTLEDHIREENSDYFGVIFPSPAVVDKEYFELSEAIAELRLLFDKTFEIVRLAQQDIPTEGGDSIQFAQRGYYIFGNRLYLAPEAEQSAAGTFDVWGSINLPDLLQGNPQAGGASSITLPTTASRFDHHYIGTWIAILTGNGSGETKKVTAYDGATKIATMDSAWSTPPDSSSTFATYSRIPTRYHRLLQRAGIMLAKGMAGDDNRKDAGLLDEGITLMTGSLTRSRALKQVNPFDPFDGVQDWVD